MMNHLFFVTSLLSISLIISANAFSAPAVYDCGYSCGKTGTNWQYPEEEAECLDACNKCRKEGGAQFDCAGDSASDCTCFK